MGVQHSKKKKEKKWKKYTDKVPPPGLTNADFGPCQLHRGGGGGGAKEIYGRPVSSGPKFYYSHPTDYPESGSTIKSVASSAPTESMLSMYNTGTRPWSSSIGHLGSDTFFKYNLDNHPDVTKLQNEQNARRENMEQRISKIRTSAIQAAERRKFAEMFKAIPKETSPPPPSLQHRTTRLLQEASAALNAFVTMETSNSTTTLTTSSGVGSNSSSSGGSCGISDQHSMRATSQTQFDEDVDDDDKGEIIPVQILTKDQGLSRENQALNFGALNFSDPVMYLLLPVLLPMFIIVCIIRGLGHQYHPAGGSGGIILGGSGGPGSSSLSAPSSSSPSSSATFQGSGISTTTAASMTDGELSLSSYHPGGGTASQANNHPDYLYGNPASTTTTYSTTDYNYSINNNNLGGALPPPPSVKILKKTKNTIELQYKKQK